MFVLKLFCFVLVVGLGVHGVPYDYTATVECLSSPYKPQYNGGIIVNPDMNNGLKAWSIFGDAKIKENEINGDKFVVAFNRKNSYGSVSQKVYLVKDRLYTFSAWVRLDRGSETVAAVFKTGSGFVHAGVVNAESGCWSMMKGGLTVNESCPAELYFESKNTSVEIWVDSVSLQPFTEKEWRSHQVQMIQKMRKVNVRVRVLNEKSEPIQNATISIRQASAAFPFGCAINKNILSNSAYQNWYVSKGFTVTTFEDEMKWYSTEYNRGHEDYSVADAMMRFAWSHNLKVRGHNIIWDDPSYQPGWVKSLSPPDLNKAVTNRLHSVMMRYQGQVISWDVVNENLHFSFFENKLGSDFSPRMYNIAMMTDPSVTLFLNEFNTIEDRGDRASLPGNYLKKIKQIKAFSGNAALRLAIGAESHFGTNLNLPFMRSALDTLASTGLPIWLTELDARSGPYQAQILHQVLVEGHAHHGVNGIVIWAPWKPEGCYRMCLTDNNFRNLPTGIVVDHFLKQWRGHRSVVTTDANGFFETSLFHGDYNLTINIPDIDSASHRSLKVAPNNGATEKLNVQVTA